MPARAWITVLLIGCYSPDPHVGAPCIDDATCPREQRCVAGRCGGREPVAPDARADTACDARTFDAAVDAPPSCVTSTTCEVPDSLGTVSGDSNGDMVTTTGTRAGWLRVRATENNSTINAAPMRVAVVLTSPSGVGFDVITYLDQGVDAVECSASFGTVATAGNVTRVQLEWGEIGGGFSNGIDDSRSISIEIRPRGTCAPDQTWMLAVHGNEL